MNKKRYSAILRFLSLTLVLIIICSAVSGCKKNFSKEAITDNISSSQDKGYNYVWNYLVDYGFPEFDKQKVAWVELRFQTYFNLAGGLPSTQKHAKLTAEMFMDQYYDEINLLKHIFL